MNGFRFTYNGLLTKSNSVPCYRGSGNRFPLGERTNVRYYFLAEEENGEKVFDLCYGKRHYRQPISEEEYQQMNTSKDKAVFGNEGDRWIYGTKANRMLRVRPDDTVEFIAETYYQGERYFLSRLSHGEFFNDSRRGGLIYQDAKVFVPICVGSRVGYDMKLLGDAKVTTLLVNRTKSKALIQHYETFFKVAETMTSAITDLDVWAATVKDVWDEHFPTYDPMVNNNLMWDEKVIKRAVSLVDESPLDTLVLAAIFYDVTTARAMAATGKRPQWNRNDSPAKVFDNTKRHLTKALYIASPDIFNERVFEFGERYPASDWPITVTLNGVAIEQYGYSAN